MQETLYKAKHRNNGEWKEGYFAKAKWYCGEKEMFVIFPKDLCIYPHCEVSEFEEVDEKTLCRCTGIRDKQGKMIWENDIVKKVDVNPLGWARERICTVSFNKLGYWELITTYGDGYFIGDFDAEQLEVIGNVFDNPELLKV